LSGTLPSEKKERGELGRYYEKRHLPILGDLAGNELPWGDRSSLKRKKRLEGVLREGSMRRGDLEWFGVGG